MGDAENNAYVPFQITYVAQNSSQPVNGYIPLDPIITPCSQALDVSVDIDPGFCSSTKLNVFVAVGKNSSLFMCGL